MKTNLVKTNINYDFSIQVVDVIKAMCMINTNGLIMAGSSSYKNIDYPNDIDLHQIVDVGYANKNIAIKQLVSYFTKMIIHLKELPNVFITDIKFGCIAEYNIFDSNIHISDNKVVGYNYENCKNKLDILHDRHVLTDDEYRSAKKVLVKHTPTVKQYFIMKDSFKFGTVRPTVNDIINGTILFRNNVLLLSDLLTTGLVKVDVMAYINNRYMEFSNIYEFKNKRTMLSPVMSNLDDSLKEDITYNYITGNYFKMAKRIFAYNVYDKNHRIVNKLLNLFNSQLGIIYNVITDIKSLIFILNNVSHISYQKLSYEINMFKMRLSHVYDVHAFLKEQEEITYIIDKLSHMPSETSSKKVFFNELSVLLKLLDAILNENTQKVLKQLHILPLNKKYLL